MAMRFENPMLWDFNSKLSFKPNAGLNGTKQALLGYKIAEDERTLGNINLEPNNKSNTEVGS